MVFFEVLILQLVFQYQISKVSKFISSRMELKLRMKLMGLQAVVVFSSFCIWQSQAGVMFMVMVNEVWKPLLHLDLEVVKCREILTRVA